MGKQIKIDFFQVQQREGDGPFADVIDRVAQIQMASRIQTTSKGPIRLQRSARWAEYGDCSEGDIVRIRIGEPAAIGALSGSLRSAATQDDEGPAESTAFLYDAVAKVLLVQRSRTGVSAPTILDYFCAKGGGRAELAAILRKDAIARLRRMTRIRKATIKVAKVADISELSLNPTLSKAISLANEMQSPTLELDFSVGKRRSASLSARHLLDLVTALLPFTAQENQGPLDVFKMEAKGNDEDGSPDALNFLNFRMTKSCNFEPSALEETNYERRRDALRLVWERSREEVRSTIVEVHRELAT